MAVGIAAERRCEIEAEAVDVHLDHPIAQAAEHIVLHHRMRGIQRVATAGVVLVVPTVCCQHVVHEIVEAAEIDGGTGLIAFCRVI